MKTQNKTLGFRKNAIIDLNNDQLLIVNGGTTPACAAAGAAASSAGCAAGAAAVGAAVGVAIAVVVDKIKN